MNRVGFLVFGILMGIGLLRQPTLAQETLTREILSATDYSQGRMAFLQRCGACHTLIDGGGDLMGPNLDGIFERNLGTKDGFPYSEVFRNSGIQLTPDIMNDWLSDPANFLPGNKMLIPEAVPEHDRAALIAYAMVKTGASDWDVPEETAMFSEEDGTIPLAERHPSFWNHLMHNTAHYQLQTKDGWYVFVTYFNEDGSITSNLDTMRGFWREQKNPGAPNRMCYALYGIPIEPYEFVECFPIVAMSIPRYGEGLWTSEPVKGVAMKGGFLSGRPYPNLGDAHPGYWQNLYANTIRYEIEVAEGDVRVIDVYFNEDKTIASNGSLAGKWSVKGKDGNEQQMCYTFSNVEGVDVDLSQCFPLETMYNPRIGARWPAAFDQGQPYWAEVVEGRE